MVNLKLLQELKDNNFPQDTLNSIVYQKSIKDEDYEIFITQDLIDDNYKDDEFSVKIAYPSFEEVWQKLPNFIELNSDKYLKTLLKNNQIVYLSISMNISLVMFKEHISVINKSDNSSILDLAIEMYLLLNKYQLIQ